MAEATIEVVLGRLVAFLEEETVAIYGLRDQVKTVVEAVRRAIKCLLKDADSQSGWSERNKNWVNDLRKVADDIEDVIDIFLVDIESNYQQKDLKGKAKRIYHMPKETLDRLKIRKMIEDIKKKHVEITRWKDALDMRRRNEEAEPRRPTLKDWLRWEACNEDEPKNVVELKKEIDELVKLLVDGEERRCVISVVGQAGIGKTVLAREVYNRAKSCFNRSAWIHVSKPLKVNEVLRELCKAVRRLSGDQIKGMDEREMQASIKKELEKEKYLVVLDDVRTRDAWDALKGVLPDGSMGSRVLITTRNARVAKNADARISPCRPPLLNQEASRKLLYRNAFPVSPESCPHELRSLATEIVKRCDGLPLALVTIGGILSSKVRQTPEAWEEFVKGLDWRITDDDDNICSSISDLGFDDLPYALKPCLLYCSAFPTDAEIRVERLLKLWIAEGFIEKQGQKKLEAVALEYLNELVDRSLIQQCKMKSIGQIKSCRIHGVLRATLVARAKEHNFFQIHSADSKLEPPNCRRVAIHHHFEPKMRPSLPLALAFISFIESGSPHNLKLLKVLDLEGVRRVKTLPEEIGDLVLLRYLGLRNTSIETISRSIKRLYNLQTLDLRTSPTIRLSKFILYSKDLKAKHMKKMTNLRHLYFGNRRG